MLFRIFLILSIAALLSNNCYSQGAWQKEVFLEIKEKPLGYALNDIRNQTNLNLIYSDELANKIIDTCCIKSSAENVVKFLLSSRGLTFKKFDDNTAVIYENKKPKTPAKPTIHKPVVKKDFNILENKITDPSLISNAVLNYPEDAFKNNLEGEVFAKILIDKSGNVSEIKLEKSSGHEILDTATINYIKRLKFHPAEYNGQPHNVWTTMLVKFNLE